MHVVHPYPTRWNPSASRYGRSPASFEIILHDLGSGREGRLHPGFHSRDLLLTAFLATNPAASRPSGFDVLVHEVIAAMTTEPCRTS